MSFKASPVLRLIRFVCYYWWVTFENSRLKVLYWIKKYNTLSSSLYNIIYKKKRIKIIDASRWGAQEKKEKIEQYTEAYINRVCALTRLSRLSQGMLGACGEKQQVMLLLLIQIIVIVLMGTLMTYGPEARPVPRNRSGTHIHISLTHCTHLYIRVYINVYIYL